jgi:putative membrane protein
MHVHHIMPGIAFGLLSGALLFAQAPSNADKTFLINAAKADMTEAHEGQIAENQGVSDQIKSFGRTLDQDHTQNFQQLQTLATKLGVTLPTGIDTEKIATIKQMEHLKGAAFDRAFARDEVTTHKQAIAEFKREAEHGSDPDVKAFAQQTIPTLQKHLDLAEQAEKSGVTTSAKR